MYRKNEKRISFFCAVEYLIFVFISRALFPSYGAQCTYMYIPLETLTLLILKQAIFYCPDIAFGLGCGVHKNISNGARNKLFFKA